MITGDWKQTHVLSFFLQIDDLQYLNKTILELCLEYNTRAEEPPAPTSDTKIDVDVEYGKPN